MIEVWERKKLLKNKNKQKILNKKNIVTNLNFVFSEWKNTLKEYVIFIVNVFVSK